MNQDLPPIPASAWITLAIFWMFGFITGMVVTLVFLT